MSKPEPCCYILGAGFSCGAGLPLSNDFLDKMEEVSKQYYLGKTPPSLNVPMDELFRFRSNRLGLFDKSLENNVEFWLSLVSARTLGSPSGRKSVKWQMQVLIAQTIAYYVHQSNKVDFLGQFIEKTNKSNDTIITLNYDDLIERSCEQNDIPYRYGFSRHGYKSYFNVDTSNHNGKMLDISEHHQSIPIYKLHGSCTWLTETEDNAEHQSIYVISDMHDFFGNHEFWATDGTKHRFVIEPPTIDKLYAGGILSVVWGRTYDSLVSACHMIVIGYSFPENDGYVKFLLMSSLSDNNDLKDVTIVDPYCDDTFKKKIGWLIDLLKAKHVEIRFCEQEAEGWIHHQMTPTMPS